MLAGKRVAELLVRIQSGITPSSLTLSTDLLGKSSLLWLGVSKAGVYCIRAPEALPLRVQHGAWARRKEADTQGRFGHCIAPVALF